MRRLNKSSVPVEAYRVADAYRGQARIADQFRFRHLAAEVPGRPATRGEPKPLGCGDSGQDLLYGAQRSRTLGETSANFRGLSSSIGSDGESGAARVALKGENLGARIC